MLLSTMTNKFKNLLSMEQSETQPKKRLHGWLGFVVRKRPPSPPPPPLPEKPTRTLRVINSTADSTPSTSTTASARHPPRASPTPPLPTRVSSLHRRSRAPETSIRHAQKGSLDSAIRYRSPAMSIVDEERPSTPKERPAASPIPRVGLSKMTPAARATKHGSFDFERPGTWGIMARTGSNGTTASSTHFQGAGLAGVGTLQRDKSVKRASEQEEAVRARERAQRYAAEVVPQDPVANSTSTHGTNKSSKSTTAKKPGKLQHGLFPFEPPVPSSARSSDSGHGEKRRSRGFLGSWTSAKVDKEMERIQAEKERARNSQKRTGRSKDRAPVPVPLLPAPPLPPSYSQSHPDSPGHRSGTKGRSLDLGLGLAWAPSRVREEALLPSSTFFKRSQSVNSHRSKDVQMNGIAVGTVTVSPHETERGQLGKEIAQVFRNALDKDGYALFKSYVHAFDADEIPFDGPDGIVSRTQRLLDLSSALEDEDKQRILDKFVRIILQQA